MYQPLIDSFGVCQTNLLNQKAPGVGVVKTVGVASESVLGLA